MFPIPVTKCLTLTTLFSFIKWCWFAFHHTEFYSHVFFFSLFFSCFDIRCSGGKKIPSGLFLTNSPVNRALFSSGSVGWYLQSRAGCSGRAALPRWVQDGTGKALQNNLHQVTLAHVFLPFVACAHSLMHLSEKTTQHN